MSDAQPTDNIAEFSVSEISGAVKQVLEGQFGYIRVRGELGRVSRPASGHVYLDLKDDRAVLSAVIWKGVAARFSVQPEEGLEVVCTGKLTTFAGQSKYQLIIDSLTPAGEGALMALLAARKKQLAAEGLFDAERKKPIPYLPDVVGIVTSPSGAVIRDILHRFADRFPRHVLVWPVRVQGENCAAEVAQAIAGFNALGAGAVPRPDLLIVARGGGSVEDLWGFNEEIVVRTIADSDIPVISAIGHETDTTLIDYAADLRAPTPTAAAELAVPVRAELQTTILDYTRRLLDSQSRLLRHRQEHLIGVNRGLPRLQDLLFRPAQILDGLAQRLAAGLQKNIQHHYARFMRMEGRLNFSMIKRQAATQHRHLQHLFHNIQKSENRVIAHYQTRLTLAAQKLKLLSHETTLERGFALVQTAKGKLVTQASDVSEGEDIMIKLAKSQNLQAQIIGSASPTPARKSPRKQVRAKKPKPEDDAQGNLL